MNWQRTSILTVLGILIFLAATIAVWGHFHGCKDLGRRLLFGAFSKQYVPGPSVEFRRLSAGHGQGPRDSDFETFEFRSSDCIKLDSFYNKFLSSEDASQEMKSRIAAASRVLSPISLTPGEDSSFVERAVIANGREYLVLRKAGNTLHSIASESLGHALEFEKRGQFELEEGRVGHP